MAHITFIPPVFKKWNFDSTSSAVLAKLEPDECDVSRTGAFTLLNVDVLFYGEAEVPAVGNHRFRYGDEAYEAHTMRQEGIGLSCEEGDRVRDMLPAWVTLSLTWRRDRMCYLLHLCPLWVSASIDYARLAHLLTIQENYGDYDPDIHDPGRKNMTPIQRLIAFAPESRWQQRARRWFDDGDDIVAYRCEQRAEFGLALEHIGKRKLLKLALDLTNEKDREVEFGADSRKNQRYSGSNTKDAPAVVFRSDHPRLGTKPVPMASYWGTPSNIKDFYTRCMAGPGDADAKCGTIRVPGLDENVLGGHVNFFRRSFSTEKRQMSTKAKDAMRESRWHVLEDDDIEFPAATRCSTWTKDGRKDTLVFYVDRHTGRYKPAPHITSAKDAQDSMHDLMIVHRSDERWRFLFLCHVSAMVRLGEAVSMMAMIPYTVLDSECSRKPRMLSPQRGMPKDITNAINEAPHCASAISHATSRLQYLAKSVPVLGRDYCYGGVEFHDPDLPILYRPTEHQRSIIGDDTTNRSGVTRCQNENRYLFGALMNIEMARLPDPEIVWPDQVAASVPASVLGNEVAEARALLLEDD